MIINNDSYFVGDLAFLLVCGISSCLYAPELYLSITVRIERMLNLEDARTKGLTVV